MLYFGVIGNRDYIKKHRGTDKEEKRPFWEYLDTQPDGWLTSMIYKRDDLPECNRMIYDCGAWSYRNEETPPINAEYAAGFYADNAPDRCMCIAPDHMLIDGVDLDFRRAWNLEQAERFIDCLPKRLTAMACIHGQTLEERLEHAEKLTAIGYRSLAIGGVAARAAQKKRVFDIVDALRAATPDAYLHVLGLSSPEYAARWHDIGIDSYDGSSHFKQAFTAGAYFEQNGSRLIKHQAAHQNPTDAEMFAMPSKCECTACSLLRSDGIDTRTYGSNENNMGRAAHNMNMLMRAQKEAVANPKQYNWQARLL